MSPYAGGEGEKNSQKQLFTGAQIDFGDLQYSNSIFCVWLTHLPNSRSEQSFCRKSQTKMLLASMKPVFMPERISSPFFHRESIGNNPVKLNKVLTLLIFVMLGSSIILLLLTLVRMALWAPRCRMA